MQINSNGNLLHFWIFNLDKEKRLQFIFKLRRRNVLTQKGKNIFRKSTALQSTDRWMTSSMTYICKQVIPLIPSKCKAIKYIALLFPKVLRRCLWFKAYIFFKLKQYYLWICGHRWGHFKLLTVQSDEYWLLNVQSLWLL